jgi:hypothetical protein
LKENPQQPRDSTEQEAIICKAPKEARVYTASQHRQVKKADKAEFNFHTQPKSSDQLRGF